MSIYGYEVKALNAERVRVIYDGELVAKFDRTEEDLQEMVESILDWAFEDGTIKSHARKKLYPETVKAILENFKMKKEEK